MAPGRGFGALLIAGFALQVPGAPVPQRLSAQAPQAQEPSARSPEPGAQSPGPPGPPSPSARQLYDQTCQTCHGNPAVPRAADPSLLRRMTPERIYEALTTGVMQSQAQGLPDAMRRGIAEYLGDRKLGAGPSGAVDQMPNRCEAAPARTAASARGATGNWNGWGADLANTRYQPAQAAGWPAVRVAALTLQWAFALPGATAVYGQPTVVDGRVYVSADSGYVYALDQRTGCVHWGFQAQAGVRGAVVVGPLDAMRRAAFFGDLKGNVYALDLATGAQLWTMRADDHALTRIVAAPVLHRGRLYVPVASAEEGASTSARYACCTFRGSVVAVKADTGAVVLEDLHDRRCAHADAPVAGGHADVRPVRSRGVEHADDRSAAERAVRGHRQQLLAARDAARRRSGGAGPGQRRGAVVASGAGRRRLDSRLSGRGPRRPAIVPRTWDPTSTSAPPRFSRRCRTAAACSWRWPRAASRARSIPIAKARSCGRRPSRRPLQVPMGRWSGAPPRTRGTSTSASRAEAWPRIGSRPEPRRGPLRSRPSKPHGAAATAEPSA